MDFNEYQKQSRKTALYTEKELEVFYPVLGLCGESGEIAEKIKKLYRDTSGKVTDELRKDLTKELGDVLWYLSQLATDLDISLDDIAKGNIEKLFSRLKRNKIHGSGDNR